MKITEASWELRNLGLKVFEIELFEDDQSSIVDIMPCVADADYLCVKVPIGHQNVIRELSELKFQFIEAVQNVAVVDLPALTSVESRLMSAVTFASDIAEYLDEAYHFIDKGLFSTDRISLDPRFSAAQAAARYKGWISDCISRGASFQTIQFRDISVGFFLIEQQKNNIYSSLLAASYAEKAPLGLGSLINYVAYKYCFDLQAKEVRTKYSLNNRAATNIHLRLPLRLIDQHYVFIKHLT